MNINIHENCYESSSFFNLSMLINLFILTTTYIYYITNNQIYNLSKNIILISNQQNLNWTLNYINIFDDYLNCNVMINTTDLITDNFSDGKTGVTSKIY